MNTQTTPPIASVTSENTTIVCNSNTAMALLFFQRAWLVGGIERCGEPLFLAVISCPIPETRPSNASRTMLTDQFSVGVLACHLVDEQVLRNDDIAFHADHFGNVRDLARAVAQASSLDHDIDRGADHFANGAGGERKAAHGDHRFNARERLARTVGVQRAHRTVMACIHGL